MGDQLKVNFGCSCSVSFTCPRCKHDNYTMLLGSRCPKYVYCECCKKEYTAITAVPEVKE